MAIHESWTAGSRLSSLVFSEEGAGLLESIWIDSSCKLCRIDLPDGGPSEDKNRSTPLIAAPG
jgi:hypothetical protein